MSKKDIGVQVAVLAVALAVPAAAREHAPRLHLVWIDPVRLAPGTYAEMKAESTLVLEGLGAEVSWSEAPDGAVLGSEYTAVIAVPTHQLGDGDTRHVMGATRPDTSLPPAVWIYPDQVAWALGFDVRARPRWSPAQRSGFARALARVVSHEVVHALGVPEHSSHGLMAATLDRRALTAASIAVDGKSAAAVQRALDGGAVVARVPAPPLRAGREATLPSGAIADRGPGG